jgi:hypothetical protein
MENLLQSHDELQAKLKQVSDQLAEEQRGSQERMRVAKEAQKSARTDPIPEHRPRKGS